MAARRDPLAVVARVRRIRERDSLLGMLQADSESQLAAERHHDVVRRLSHDPAEPGREQRASVAAYTADRLALARLEQHGTEVRAAHASAEVIATTARSHWQRDRVQLEAIDMLRERRAADRRAEHRAHEARELDEVALQTWVRHHGTPEVGA